MKFYTENHQHHCGIDLHARSLYVCILNDKGEIVLHMSMITTMEPFRDRVNGATSGSG
jgi:hypothetical protein